MPTKRSQSSMTTHRVPLVTHDYRCDPSPYPALKTEQGVFTTPPYSEEIKHLWRFKDEQAAKHSAQEIWDKWDKYKAEGDFVGMDTARKFIQMGRTRSLRYALRPGGRKYEYVRDDEDATGGSSKTDGDTKKGGKKRARDADDDDGAHDALAGTHKVAMQRTGKVYDAGKLKGAQVFEGYLDRCWADEAYKSAWEAWKRGERDVLVKVERVGSAEVKQKKGDSSAEGTPELEGVAEEDARPAKKEIRVKEEPDVPRAKDNKRAKTGTGAKRPKR